MSERPFWFEEYPEDQKYWFLAPLGTSPRLEAQREDERRELGLTEQDAAELSKRFSDVQRASVFGSSEQEAANSRQELVKMLERMEASGYGEKALEGPNWPDVNSVERTDRGGEHSVPLLYTKKKLAEEELDRVRGREGEYYRQLVEQYGTAKADEDWAERLPFRVLWVDRETLIDKLEESHFLYVMVDGKLKQRRDFIEELRADEKKGE